MSTPETLTTEDAMALFHGKEFDDRMQCRFLGWMRGESRAARECLMTTQGSIYAFVCEYAALIRALPDRKP